jgi:hypothetical protein
MPGRSFFDPTRYHTQTLTVGLAGIGATWTESPFASAREWTAGRRKEVDATSLEEPVRHITADWPRSKC